MSDVVIAGFSPGDKTPGFYGQVQYGVGGASSGLGIIGLMLVGLMTSAGNLGQNTEVRQVYQPSDVDTAAGIGSELATMAYDALAAQPEVPIFLASPLLPSGATASTASIAISGTPTTGGSIGVRIDGYPVIYNVPSGEPAATSATNFAALIAGANAGRLPVTAAASGTNVVLTDVTPSIRGNQHVVFLITSDGGTSVLPEGTTVSITGAAWSAGQAVTTASYTVPTIANGFYYKVTTAGSGTTGAAQPTWPTTPGTATTADSNGVVWTCWGQIVTGGGVTLGGGAGLETYTTLIGNLSTKGYGRYGLAANDAVSAAAWKTKFDGDAGALVGYLEHGVWGFNASQSGAISLAQTTLNDQRCQVVFELNAETHPPRMAAVMAADRAFQEAIDPNYNFDDYPIAQIVPQSQPADFPLHSQLVTMLNAGVTPLLSSTGQTTVCRSITTKCLTNSQPDYSTLDTGTAVTPDFVLVWMKSVWVIFQQANRRVRGPLQTGEKQPRSGVAYPALWNGKVTSNMLAMSRGDIPGDCPPILDPTLTAANPPVTDLDALASGRLMTSAPCYAMQNLHQLGLNVQQSVPSLAA